MPLLPPPLSSHFPRRPLFSPLPPPPRLQTFLTFLALFLDVSGLRQSRGKKSLGARLTNIEDFLHCLVFATANVVTVLYIAIDTATGDAVEENGVVPRPLFHRFMVHYGNALYAWADILVSHPRSFSKDVHKGIAVFLVVYVSWILHIKHVTGLYPYPFLNKLPHPTGVLIVTVFAIGVSILVMKLGRWTRATFHQLSTRPINFSFAIEINVNKENNRKLTKTNTKTKTKTKTKTLAVAAKAKGKGKVTGNMMGGSGSRASTPSRSRGSSRAASPAPPSSSRGATQSRSRATTPTRATKGKGKGMSKVKAKAKK